MKQSIDLTTTERRALIVKQLEKSGQVEVAELSDQYNVSLVTIRNDLSYLEDKGLVYRVRGGAIQHNKVGLDLAFSEKAKKNETQKHKIGLKAVELICEDDTVIFDSGSTTIQIARNLNQFKHITVITHALSIASELAGSENIELIMLGGVLREKSLSFVGTMTKDNIKNYFADILFLGVDSFDVNYGISTPSIAEAQINRVMADISHYVVVVTDSSKFGKRSLANILPVSRIHKVITDKDIRDEDRQVLENEGVEVIIA